MKYWDIIDIDEFWDMIEEGYIRVQSHPDFPDMRIANYTDKAVFDRMWNPSTRVSRGLIFDANDGHVYARPFPKFFNYGEDKAAKIELTDEVWVSDKVDGSLGIVYVAPDDSVRVATRGSFESEQALHATKVLNEKYPGWVSLFRMRVPNATPLVEIVYPENRIVCDYGSLDDLVLLGWLDRRSGSYFPANMGDWDGPRVQSFDFENFSQVLAARPRPGAEGFVVYSPMLNNWVKVKQEDYIELHRIVTGLSARRVYEALVSGRSVEEVCAPLPDEFHPFVREVADILTTRVQEASTNATEEFNLIRMVLGDRGVRSDDPGYRKEFAMLARRASNAKTMFLLLDGKDITQYLWSTFEPDASWTPNNHRWFV